MENKGDYLKRLLYRSWHRGCKETDILLGNYAKASLAALSDEELQAYEEILGCSDNDIYAWLVGRQEVPANISLRLVCAIRSFHAG